MNTRILKLTIIAFSIVFVALIITEFISDRLYSASLKAEEGDITTQKALTLLDYAIKLDPTNAELYFRKYELTRETRKDEGVKVPTKKELFLLKKCIQLRPFWPKYHFCYGLTLAKMNPHPNAITRELVLSELKKAAELKPFSKLYQNTYQARLEEK